jgi:hypothetical protein
LTANPNILPKKALSRGKIEAIEDTTPADLLKKDTTGATNLVKNEDIEEVTLPVKEPILLPVSTAILDHPKILLYILAIPDVMLEVILETSLKNLGRVSVKNSMVFE